MSYNKFWYFDGKIWPVPADKEHVIWGEEYVKEKGEIEAGIDMYEDGKYMLRRYGTYFGNGWIRGYANYQGILLHGFNLESKGRLRRICEAVISAYPEQYTNINEIKIDVEAVSPGKTWGPTTSYTGSQILTDGASTQTSGAESYWEPGPADEWINRIHKRIGLARLKKRRQLRASLLSSLLN